MRLTINLENGILYVNYIDPAITTLTYQTFLLCIQIIHQITYHGFWLYCIQNIPTLNFLKTWRRALDMTIHKLMLLTKFLHQAIFFSTMSPRTSKGLSANKNQKLQLRSCPFYCQLSTYVRKEYMTTCCHASVF